MAFKDDFKNLQAMIQTMESEMEMLDDLTNGIITDVYDLDLSIKSKLLSVTEEEISSMTEEEAIKLLNECNSNDENNNVEILRESHSKSTEYCDKEFIEYVRNVFSSIKKSIDETEKMREEKIKLEKEANEITENYFNYINSAEYKEKKRQKLQELREQAESEEDIVKKNKILNMLTAMDESETLHFLFARIEKLGDKEIKNIKDIFFDNTRSSLVIEKFNSRLPRYGYNPDVYKKFFNLEENFLPDEYNKFNNLFLFHIMRFISFTDTYDKTDTLFVSTILSRLYNLIYHRYENQEIEDEFISLIKKFADYFVPYSDEFVTKNITSPDHPHRIQRDKEYEEKRRVMIIASLQNEGIEPDTTLETEELRKMLQDVMEKKQNGTSEVETEETTNEETEDSVNIEDAINKPIVETESEEVKTIGELEEVIDKIEASPELEEFEKLQEEIADSIAIEEDVETAETEEDEVVEETTATNEVDVYVDIYDCYYISDGDTYAYCDKDNNVIEEDILEDTVLKLISAGSLTKKKMTI